MLAEMLASGVTHVVMEVSSHGIDRHRVDHCLFDVGVFTNLSQDHLDYHGNMDAYWRCKQSWFTDHLCRGPKRNRTSVVLNRDDARGRELFTTISGYREHPRLITIGHGTDNLTRPKKAAFTAGGISGEIATPQGSFTFRSGLVGEHNLENILCAVGVGEALHLPLGILRAGIESLDSVPGRLEAVPNDQHRYVYVDYAHTPDALHRVLTTLKALATGRLICVFGCGGNRDREKRSTMGGIAARHCDLSVVTSDNPRTEDPDRIIRDICSGIRQHPVDRLDAGSVLGGFQGRGYVVMADRKRAICLAVAGSGTGDTILIAGKGDETYQTIGEQTLDFDDRKVAKTALSLGIEYLRRLNGLNGMGYLDAVDNG